MSNQQQQNKHQEEEEQVYIITDEKKIDDQIDKTYIRDKTTGQIVIKEKKDEIKKDIISKSRKIKRMITKDILKKLIELVKDDKTDTDIYILGVYEIRHDKKTNKYEIYINECNEEEKIGEYKDNKVIIGNNFITATEESIIISPDNDMSKRLVLSEDMNNMMIRLSIIIYLKGIMTEENIAGLLNEGPEKDKYIKILTPDSIDKETGVYKYNNGEVIKISDKYYIKMKL